MKNRKCAIEYNAVASAFGQAPRMDYDSESPGLTKREYFAARFMEGILANKSQCGDVALDSIVQYAIYCADTLLIALEDRPSVDFAEVPK